MTAAAIVTAVRECGARFAIVDGRLVLRGNASRVPAELLREIRPNETEIRVLIEPPRAVQIPFGFAAPGAPRIRSARSFLDRESERFDALLVRFGVHVAPAGKKRGAAR
jgi:hypothetical protein